MARPLAGVAIPAAAPRRDLLARLRRLPPTLIVGSLILAGYLFIAITGPVWAPYSPTETGTGPVFARLSLEHFLGTDQLGRDIFSRVIHGTGDVLLLALSSTAVGMVVGTSLGLVSGYLGGWFDEILMRAFDVIIGIPSLLLALLIISASGAELGGSPALLISVVGFVYAPRIARMARAVAVDLTMCDFVTVARARGESAWSIMWRELLPNASGTLLVEFGVRASYAPIFIGSLGFLGFGMRPPSPEWGLMISENRVALVSAPATVLGPAVALALLVVGLNLFTEGMARVLGRSVQYGSA